MVVKMVVRPIVKLSESKSPTKFMSSEEVAKADTLATGQAHVNRALYSDPDILKKFPHFPILLKSIETANPRPKVVKYGDATLESLTQ
jgi:multiple sugar transport system substrate-binding protein